MMGWNVFNPNLRVALLISSTERLRQGFDLMKFRIRDFFPCEFGVFVWKIDSLGTGVQFDGGCLIVKDEDETLTFTRGIG